MARRPRARCRARLTAPCSVSSCAGVPSAGQMGVDSLRNTAAKYADRSVSVATVERELLIGPRRSTAMPAATGARLSMDGRWRRSRNCRA